MTTTHHLRPSPHLISLEDAAGYAGISIRTVRRWIADGRLPGYRVGPRLMRVDQNDLDELARRIPAAAMTLRICNGPGGGRSCPRSAPERPLRGHA